MCWTVLYLMKPFVLEQLEIFFTRMDVHHLPVLPLNIRSSSSLVSLCRQMLTQTVDCQDLYAYIHRVSTHFRLHLDSATIYSGSVHLISSRQFNIIKTKPLVCFYMFLLKRQFIFLFLIL